MRTPQRTSHLGNTLGRLGQAKHSKMSVTRKAVYAVLLLAVAVMLLRTPNYRSAAPSSTHSTPYAETDSMRYTSTTLSTTTDASRAAIASSPWTPVDSSTSPASPFSLPNEPLLTSHVKNAPTPAPSALTFWAATERAEVAHAAAVKAEQQEVAPVLALSPCKDAVDIDGPGLRRAKKLTWLFERQQRSHNYHDLPTSPGGFGTPLGDLCRAQENTSAIACPLGCHRVTGEPYCAAGNSKNSKNNSSNGRNIGGGIGLHEAPCRLTAAVLARARADAYATLVASRSELKRAARIAERAPLRVAALRRREEIANAEAENIAAIQRREEAANSEAEKKAAIQRREETANAEAERALEIEKREAEANAEAEAAAFEFAKAAVMAAVSVAPPQATPTSRSNDLATHDRAENTTEDAASRIVAKSQLQARTQPSAAVPAPPPIAKPTAAVKPVPSPLTSARGAGLAAHLAALDKAAAEAQPSSHSHHNNSGGSASADLEAWRDAYFFACFDNGESYGASWFASTASVFRRVVATGPREHMETAGGLGQPPGNTPLKTVNLLDFSVEHVSWLDRRLGLRYMQGHLKTSLTSEFLAFLKKREVKARQDALEMQAARLQQQHKEEEESSRAEAVRYRRQRQRRRRLRAKDENPVPDGQPGGTQRSALPSANETAPWQGEDGFLESEGDGGKGSARRVRKPVKVIAVFPYFATTDHCSETGPAASKGKSLGSAEPGARCDSGSSDPLLRRYFLNLTFWTVRCYLRNCCGILTCIGCS